VKGAVDRVVAAKAEGVVARATGGEAKVMVAAAMGRVAGEMEVALVAEATVGEAMGPQTLPWCTLRWWRSSQ
jgi:hypothetical protein